MRRPLLASLLIAVIAVLATTAFLASLGTRRAVADEPPGRPASGGPGAPTGPGGPPPREMAPFDTSIGHADTMVAEMLHRLGDKAALPAESVYKNIVILKGMPAGALPKVMVYGFSRGLGVRCGYCHVRDDFASDERPHKKSAREMWKMTGDINHSYLANMKELEDEAPIVTCWTCHRSRQHPDETVMR